MYKKYCNLSIVFLFLGLLTGCEKILEVPSNKSLVIPRSTEDLQALMDRDLYTVWDYPSADEESSDDLFVTDAGYNGITDNADQQRYLWAPYHIFKTSNEWTTSYSAINTMNIVLEFVEKFEKQNKPGLSYIKGQALFWRANRFWEITKVWTLPYDVTTASSDLGIPLRLESDFNIPSSRSTLEETYSRILKDLQEAIPLLTVDPLNAMRPSKQAAYGLLARVYLNMRDYDAAGRYADSCLQIHNDLMDYNQISVTAANPFLSKNKEVVLHFRSNRGEFLNPGIARIPVSLYKLYSLGDLRQKIFFLQNTDASYQFKGSYLGTNGWTTFKGITTAEMYLVRAESHARAGRVSQSLKDLQHLMRHRWLKTLDLPILSAESKQEALLLVLNERRRELVQRGLRWDDIRRLNKEGFGIVQERIVNGQKYTLPPNDLRYALAIPDIVIERSSIIQNPRNL